MRKRIKIPILSFLAFAAISCKNPYEHQVMEFYDISDEGILPLKEFLFSPFKESDNKTGKEYDLLLSLRFTDKCRIKELPLKIEYSSLEDDTITTFNYVVTLFDKKDKWDGSKSFGVYETVVPILTDVKSKEGFYLLVTPQNSMPVQGIISMGILSEK